MRVRSVILVGPCLALAGCNQFELAGYNLANESISRRDENKFDDRLASEARCVWKDVCRQYPARTFTPEFADGFTDGYVDYLDVGGTPQPPAVPPPRYRRSSYLTPHGHALVKDYMVGFQYGVEVAVATGKREFLTVPVLLGEAGPSNPLNVTRIPAPPEASLDGPGGVVRPAVPVPTVPVALDPVPLGQTPVPVVPVPVPSVPVAPDPVPEVPRTSGLPALPSVPPLSSSRINTPSDALPVIVPLMEPPPSLPPVADPLR